MVGNQVVWYWYEMKPYTHGLEITSWYGLNMWCEWGLVTDVGMRFLCMIYILLGCLNTIGMWSVRNSMSL